MTGFFLAPPPPAPAESRGEDRGYGKAGLAGRGRVKAAGNPAGGGLERIHGSTPRTGRSCPGKLHAIAVRQITGAFVRETCIGVIQSLVTPPSRKENVIREINT